jgi:hypothetical protein
MPIDSLADAGANDLAVEMTGDTPGHTGPPAPLARRQGRPPGVAKNRQLSAAPRTQLFKPFTRR